MSEVAPEAQASSNESAETEQQQPKPTETVEFWKQKARENEKRAKSNADAAAELDKIRESQKTEAQKTADRLAIAEREAATAKTDSLRWRIAAKHQIGDEDAELFLTGSDEETLTKQAQRLVQRESDRKKQGNHVPREGNNPAAPADQARETARQLFGSG